MSNILQYSADILDITIKIDSVHLQLYTCSCTSSDCADDAER